MVTTTPISKRAQEPRIAHGLSMMVADVSLIQKWLLLVELN